MEVEKSAKGSYSENADFVAVEKSANGSYGENADHFFIFLIYAIMLAQTNAMALWPMRGGRGGGAAAGRLILCWAYSFIA